MYEGDKDYEKQRQDRWHIWSPGGVGMSSLWSNTTILVKVLVFLKQPGAGVICKAAAKLWNR